LCNCRAKAVIADNTAIDDVCSGCEFFDHVHWLIDLLLQNDGLAVIGDIQGIDAAGTRLGPEGFAREDIHQGLFHAGAWAISPDRAANLAGVANDNSHRSLGKLVYEF